MGNYRRSFNLICGFHLLHFVSWRQMELEQGTSATHHNCTCPSITPCKAVVLLLYTKSCKKKGVTLCFLCHSQDKGLLKLLALLILLPPLNSMQWDPKEDFGQVK
ncbi:hypothetical protein J5N97_009895 [Dioscorea zingiberensis]|uniref:Uncharacterized protein n=1 Tax=Dioscorea zingiberensis TaxID=325984 RepID=A0A9D5D0C3_9LILI|nr:hypothetical protein J5N97_009895 [Dioscorea zingiberensis]